MLCMSCVIALGCAYMIALARLGKAPSEASMVLYNFAFALIVVYAVDGDRRERALAMPYEYNAFLFFLWPVALPIYLFQTRRWLGLTIGVGTLMLSEVPSLAAIAVYP